MSLVVNHNLMAANTARNLNTHYGHLATSTQRLSSGLRINGSADDAAGLAIRELMRADVAALNQGVRNANDAISMIQVVDGALGIIDEKLIRMKELAEQAATGTYDSTQRLMIDSEFKAMASEIQRIAIATDFNGIKLIDGTASNMLTTQDIIDNLGIALNTPIVINNINNIDNKGSSSSQGSTLRLIDITQTRTGTITEEYRIIDNSIYKVTTTDSNIQTDTTTTIYDGEVTKWSWDGSPLCDTNKVAIYFNPQTLNGPEEFINKNLVNKPLDKNRVVDIDYFPNSTDGTWDNRDSNNLYICYVDAGNDGIGDISYFVYLPVHVNNDLVKDRIKIESIDITKTGPTTVTTNDHEFSEDFEKIYNLPAKVGIPPNKVKIHFGPMNDLAEDYYYIDKHDCTLKGLGLEDTRIETQDNAQKALVTINDAIIKKDQARAYYGAMQNRLENTVSNLTIQAENLQASESRISDVDVATEMTNFVRNQILTQSAVAMLSQANSMPQMAMQLISG